MVEETQRKLQGREQELRDREETFRKRLDQKSRNACATRGGRSTRWWTR